MAPVFQDSEDTEQRLQEMPASQQEMPAIVQEMPASAGSRPTNKRTREATIQSPGRGNEERSARRTIPALSPANYVRQLAQSYQQASILPGDYHSHLPHLELATSHFCQTHPLDGRHSVSTLQIQPNRLLYGACTLHH